MDGSAVEVENWLRTGKFDPSIIGIFAKWNAQAILHVSEAATMREVPGSDGERLWAPMSAAKTLQCKPRLLQPGLHSI